MTRVAWSRSNLLMKKCEDAISAITREIKVDEEKKVEEG